MKHLVLFALPLLVLAACTSRPSAENNRTGTTIDSTLTTRPAAASSAALPNTARISSLSLSPNFDWKQVKLGDALTSAKAPETEQPFEEDASHVGYSVEFDNLESVDYQYYTKAEKVAGIRIDLYLNNPASVRVYQQDLLAYYNARYGTAQPNAGLYTWRNGTVTLKDVSKAKEFGLVIKIGNVPKTQ